ncbi:hypothetical protein [Actinomadura sp. WMMA1423]|uniref:hypothetical protein n=1 Tax=Actinomadura sp. WMMA1423 TaxID=2591108 RepID=UPI00114613B4|nr:hypothetical protein [Actinomadura sp. WMMA1423]
MDAVADWTTRIAERVAPDEADFAAEVGRAYASGGKSRAALFPRPGAEPGGFGPADLVGDLPVILRALADSAESLRHLLATKELGNVVAIVTLAVAARQSRSGARKQDGGGRTAGKGDGGTGNGGKVNRENPDIRPPDGAAKELAGGGGGSGTGSAAPEAKALESAHRELADRLANDGILRPHAELIAYRLLLEFLSDPGGGEEFLRRLRGEP